MSSPQPPGLRPADGCPRPGRRSLLITLPCAATLTAIGFATVYTSSVEAPGAPQPILEDDMSFPANWQLPRGADPAPVCASWFANLSSRHGMRPLDEALNMTLPRKVRLASDLTFHCELLLQVSGDAVYVHRRSLGAASYRRRKGWFYCGSQLRVGRLRRLDQGVRTKHNRPEDGPPCRGPVLGPASAQACCIRTIFPKIVVALLDLLALLRTSLGGASLPRLVVPLESVDVPWCTRATAQHTNSSESRLVRVLGGVPKRPRAAVVISHSRPHPRFVPHSLLLPLSGNQAFASTERNQSFAGGQWGRMQHAVRVVDGTVAATGHNPPPELRLYQELRRAVPWEARVPRAIWRGAPTGTPLTQHLWGLPPNTTARRQLMRVAERAAQDPGSAGVLDVAFGKLPLKELMRHRIVLAVDGHSYASVLKHALLAGSLTVRVGGAPDPESRDLGSSFEWFEPLLRPGVHYLRARSDASDLLDKVRWALGNDAEARAVAARGAALMQALQHPLSALCYTRRALDWLHDSEAAVLSELPEPPPGSDWLHLADITR
eukprot:TRINITY_DN29462_c0_g1_i1.p1 TRINITY_DN29462_c0_g1~~TRINITY_DN29462_c0_g1_i1.p1  ORF type:complete len:548 (+),score=35.52 TRINITY_DN29462_c0_g1_i1:82-1725(+)